MVNNLVGQSEWTDYVSATTGIKPSRPGILTFDATTRTTIHFTWESIEGANTGGSIANPLPISSYRLFVNDGMSGSLALHSVIDGGVNSFAVTNLKPGLTYSF
jgi:hypothetical protein